MSVSKLKKLAEEAFLLLSYDVALSGFARACLVLGVDVYPEKDRVGVVVRNSRFIVMRFRDSDGFVVSTVSDISD